MNSRRKFIDDLVASVNILDVIQKERGQFVEMGDGKHKGCCPFHSEKTPSFIVDESTQSFVCYGCGTKGNVITFLVTLDEDGNFNNAIDYLVEFAKEKNNEKLRDSRPNRILIKNLFAIDEAISSVLRDIQCIREVLIEEDCKNIELFFSGPFYE